MPWSNQGGGGGPWGGGGGNDNGGNGDGNSPWKRPSGGFVLPAARNPQIDPARPVPGRRTRP